MTLATPFPSTEHAPLVLVVEDDDSTRQCIRAALNDQSLRVVETATGMEALMQAAAHNPDLVLLDYMLPDLDGLQVTTKLRSWSAAPILVVSAHDDENAKISSLDAGANDYVTKPFTTGELLARIRVWLRFLQRASAQCLDTTIEIGELKVDLSQRRAFFRGEHVALTRTQFKLFATLMRNAGRVMTHEELLSAVWGPGRAKETQYLRVYMGQLRSKFEPDSVRCRYFVTEPGVGYRLQLPPA
jgi:two-component system KDP operon response regulator KdpE